MMKRYLAHTILQTAFSTGSRAYHFSCRLLASLSFVFTTSFIGFNRTSNRGTCFILSHETKRMIWVAAELLNHYFVDTEPVYKLSKT